MIQFKIPNHPKVKFSTILNSRRVTITLWYNSYNDRWSADVSIDGAPVLYGRKIVTGVDLLKPFNFGIGVLFAWSTEPKEATRNDLHLGIVKLYHTTEEEINAAMAS